MSFSVGQFWYWKFDWKISCQHPQLRWWSPWPPDLKFGRPGHHFSRQNWALLSLKFNPFMYYLQLLLRLFFFRKSFHIHIVLKERFTGSSLSRLQIDWKTIPCILSCKVSIWPNSFQNDCNVKNVRTTDLIPYKFYISTLFLQRNYFSKKY